MAVGTLLGGACQYLIQVPSLRREGLRYHWEWALSDPGLRQVLRLMGPAVIGAAAVQVNVVVNSNFASQITNASGEIIDGPVSWLGYAFRFMQLPLGLFGVAVASATLPAISRSAGEGRIGDFRATVSRSLGLVFLFTIPSAAGLIVLSEPIVGLVYERGRFSAFDTEQTALALSFYCLGLASYAAIKVLTPAFYALDAVRVPVAASVVSIVVNCALNWTFLRVLDWGHWGLALATSLVATFNFLVLLVFLARRIGGLGARRLLDSGLRVALATAAMAAVALAMSSALTAQLGPSFWGRAVNVGLSSGVGLLALYQAAKLLRVPELAFAEQMVRGRFQRAFR